MSHLIRHAILTDIPAMLYLSEQKHLQYQDYQPIFWRKAADAREKQRPFFERLVQSEDVISLISEQDGTISGFIIANLVAAPPVYDPGGKTCTIDDFCVSDEHTWESAGRALLDEAIHIAEQRRAIQTVVVCGHLDEPKRAMLSNGGFTIASEWYVK